jgi:hypothetical protein
MSKSSSLCLYSSNLVPWVVPFQKYVHQRLPVSKMAAITKNRTFFKWPKLLYFKPEIVQI